MKRVFFICMLIMLNQSVSAETIGRLFLGRSTFLGTYKTGFSTAELNRHGGRIGFYLPLSIPYIDSHLKFSAAKHTYEKGAGYSSYVYATNELLIGKELHLFPKISLVPQTGLGVIGDVKYYSDKSYYGNYVDFFYSLSCIVDIHFDELAVGLLLEYADGFEIAARTPTANRFALSLIFSL
jgi:hypothetical protein